MRAVLIFLGLILIEKFDWMFYVFGLFLFATGVKMLLVDLYKIPIPGMLGTVFAILVVSIGASLLLPPVKADVGGEAR